MKHFDDLKYINDMNKAELIKNRIIDFGCDCWVTDEDFVLLKCGFIKAFLINNTLNLIGGVYPMSIDTIALLCIDQHQTSKEIKEGKYDNFTSNSTLKDIINKIKLN